METSMFFYASLLFIILTLSLFGLIIYGLHYCLQRVGWKPIKKKKILLFTAAGFLCWFACTGILAANGFFLEFKAMPPRMLVVLLPPLMFIISLTFTPAFTQLLKLIPPAWLIATQSFRVLMEIILWMAFLDNIIPVQMTFEGHNFDILVGLTAPLIAYFCFIKKSWPHQLAVIWNILGLLLLANIVVVSILSAPVPFRVFMNEPANTFIAHLPFVWLPSFVVPVAYWMHILSLKQLLMKSEIASNSHTYPV
jgi:hypothetical protein